MTFEFFIDGSKRGEGGGNGGGDVMEGDHPRYHHLPVFGFPKISDKYNKKSFPEGKCDFFQNP